MKLPCCSDPHRTSKHAPVANLVGERAPVKSPYSMGRCHGDAPIRWSSSTECRATPALCGDGDMDFALNFSQVPRCNSSGGVLRTFNRSMVMHCMDTLARRRDPSSDTFRLLVMGISNSAFVWHALAVDESVRWPGISYTSLHAKQPACNHVRPDYAQYAPHGHMKPTVLNRRASDRPAFESLVRSAGSSGRTPLTG